MNCEREWLFSIGRKTGKYKAIMGLFENKYASSFDYWNTYHPEIYSEILKQIQRLIDVLNAESSYKEIDTQRNILKEKIEILTNSLEEKLR